MMSAITECKAFYHALLTLALVASTLAITVPQDIKASRDIVQNFETVHPQVLQETRHTRNVHPDALDVEISTDSGETFTLQLTLNDKLIAPQFTSVYFAEDGKEIEITDQVNCFYHGQVLEHPEWTVAMDSCQGLRGSFGDWSNKTLRYNIEPLDQDNSSLNQPHALYQADDSEEEGECGTTHEHFIESENPLNLNEDELERARRQSPTGAYIVELCIVNDRAQYIYYQRNISRTVARALSLVNVVDRIYSSQNVRVVLVRSITWTTGDRSQFSQSPDTTLQNFRTFTQSLQSSHDAIVLLTGNDFSGNTVGIAYLNTMCGSAAVGVVQDRHSNAVSTGSTFAHEVGHLLSLEHDTSSCICTDPSRRCVMAAVSSVPPPERWSSCSVNRLRTALTRTTNNLGRCLNNEPTTTVGQPVCGNGIREGDEICDCGSVGECDDPCCDARTCRLAAGAQCTRGECCSNTCRFKSASTTCRSSSGQCDIQERCTGQSAECPTDVYLQDGTPCNNNQAYCFSGECKTYNQQCQTHFRTNKGVNECFTSYNTGGNYFGNCGTDGTNFIPCPANHVMCGQLFCQPGEYQNTVNSVYVVTVGAYVPSRRRVEECVAFTPPPTSDVISPGLVDDGVKCGTGKLCYEQRCVSVSSLGSPQCPSGSNGRVCSGNGVCNNKGRCSCNAGFSGPTCTSSSVNECLTNNGGCAHVCVDTASSFYCQCRSGFTLAPDGRSCNPTPVNECLTNNGGCAHVCVDTASSFYCQCRSGFTLAPDRRSCNPIPTNGCGGRLTAASGSFQTPEWPERYPQDDFECEWIIDVAVTGYALQFTIDRSDYGINGRPPCSNDYIQFFDGLASNADSLHKLCRFDNPGAITTSTSEAKVVFAGSENSARPASRVGARVTYTLVDIDECVSGTHNCEQQCVNTAGSYRCSCNSGYTLDSNGRSCTAIPTTSGCGGRLTGYSGSFQTPEWPVRYPLDGVECEWTIELPSTSYKIDFTFDFSAFGINGRHPCSNDYIQFFDGTSSNAPSIRKICGLQRFYNPFPTIRSNTSRARVVFVGSSSNRPSSRVGVKVNYRAIPL